MNAVKRMLFCLFCMAIAFSKTAVAASQDEDYQAALQYAQNIQQTTANKALQTKAEDIPGFAGDDVAQSQLIDKDLTLAGQQAAQDDNNEGAQALIAGFNLRPEFTITSNDPALRQGQRYSGRCTKFTRWHKALSNPAAIV